MGMNRLSSQGVSQRLKSNLKKTRNNKNIQKVRKKGVGRKRKSQAKMPNCTWLNHVLIQMRWECGQFLATFSSYALSWDWITSFYKKKDHNFTFLFNILSWPDCTAELPHSSHKNYLLMNVFCSENPKLNNFFYHKDYLMIYFTFFPPTFQ